MTRTFRIYPDGRDAPWVEIDEGAIEDAIATVSRRFTNAHERILLGCARAMLEPPTGESAMQLGSDKPDPMPEITLATMFKNDLNVEISPQALRVFIRWRWDDVRRLAHLIHGSKP